MAKDRDQYVQWVMAADGPGAVGDRAYWLAEITEYHERQHYGFTPKPGFAPEDIMRLADQTGTTAPDKRGEPWSGDPENGWPHEPSGHWDDKGFICDQRWLPRAHLPAYIDAYLKNGGYMPPDVDAMVERRILQEFDDNDGIIDNGPPL